MSLLEKGLQCTSCKKVGAITPFNYAECHLEPAVLVYGPPVRGRELRQLISRGPPNIFKWLPILPIDEVPETDSPLSKVGSTGLVIANDLAKSLGFGSDFYVYPDEGPLSGTFKDNGVTIASLTVRQFIKQGYDVRATIDSTTGNLGVSHGAVAYILGVKAVVFIPSDSSHELIERAAGMGAYVVKVNTDYDTMNEHLKHAMEYRQLAGIFGINLGLRHIYGEGSKTIGPEIARQLGWRAPDAIVHPIAAGLSLSRIYNGLDQARGLGLIDSLPTRMYGAQAERYHSIRPTGNQQNPFELVDIQETSAVLPSTLRVRKPTNVWDIIETLVKSNGSTIGLTDAEVYQGMQLVKDNTPFSTGPVGGTVVAAAKKLREKGQITPDESTVLVLTDAITGNFDYESTIRGRSKGQISEIEPGIKNIVATLEQILAA